VHTIAFIRILSLSTNKKNHLKAYYTMRCLLFHSQDLGRISCLFRLVNMVKKKTGNTLSTGRMRNCVDVTGPAAAHVACCELVWANGVEFRMTFANQGFKSATPSDKLDNFYVVGPQTDAPQGTPPFLHDHVVRDVPGQNHGEYSVKLRGIFALCSAQGITSRARVPHMTSYAGLETLPLAQTINYQRLTSVGTIAAAASSGVLTLLDTGAVLFAKIRITVVQPEAES
jgi:hypothetical protein